MAELSQDHPLPLLHRLWTYQRERFPLAAHGLSVAAFAAAGVNVGRMSFAPDITVPWTAYAVAGVVLFCQFFLLRVADEFKDAATDARFRPERPVPRGLVSLQELRNLGIAAFVLQFVSVLLYDVRLLPVLGLITLWFGLMSVEFLAGGWLKRRPALYMISHMMIMPLLALFIALTAAPYGAGPWPALLSVDGVWAFCALSFAAGILLETGRKIRTKEQERPGVETYTALWGARRAVAVWLLAACASVLFGLWTASFLGSPWATAITAGAGLLAALVVASLWMIRPRSSLSSVFELFSGIWVLALLIPLSPAGW